MMQAIRNQMLLAAKMADATRASTRIGIVTSFDPNSYSAVVKLQPDGMPTGWLPVVSPWTGNGWGLFAPPTPGDLVEVQFVDDSIESGFVCQRFFNDADRPLPCPSGEFWLVHQSGSLLKFHNDGTVELHANAAINSSAPVWNHTGPVNITGDVTITGNETVSGNVKAAGDITDRYTTQSRTIAGLRTVYNSHTHNENNAAGGPTNTPNQTA